MQFMVRFSRLTDFQVAVYNEPGCRFLYRSGFIRAEGYLTCRVVTKGIKADCNYLMRTYSAKR